MSTPHESSSSVVDWMPRRTRRGHLLVVILGVLLSAPTLAATFVVDTTSDNGVLTACTAAAGDCSLRGAILRANATVEADDISFLIPTSEPGCNVGTGVCRIEVTEAFPISRPLTIDGYTQPGALPNTIPAPGANNAQLKIEITSAGFVNLGVGLFDHGLGSAGSPFIVRGLAMAMPTSGIVGRGGLRHDFRGNWFCVDASGQSPDFAQPCSAFDLGSFLRSIQVGGPDPADRNVIAGGGRNGAGQPFGGSNRLRVNSIANERGQLLLQGNLIGLAPDGITPLPMRDPFNINTGDDAFQTPDIRILDNRFARAQRGGNTGGALQVSISRVMNEVVPIQGNIFGLGVDGSVVGVEKDHILVFLGNSSRVPRLLIGGFGPGEGNTFAGAIRQSSTSTSLGSAVLLPVGAGNANTFVEFVGNRMLGNEGIGLDIPTLSGGGAQVNGRTPNDPGDPDVGANNLQNYPTISAYSVDGNQFDITYQVDSAPANSSYPLRVDFYKALGDEGEVLLDSDVYAEVNAQQDKSVTLSVPSGVSLTADDVIIAIATDAQGRSSEFNFYEIQNLTILSDDPDPTPAGVPYIVSVRAVAAPGEPFAPNGDVKIVDGRGGECRATLAPTATAGRAEGSCELTTTGAPGTVTLTASLSSLESAFALATGASVANATASHGVTAGIDSLELVSGNNQSTPVGAAFAQPLVVRVLAAGGAPLAGVPVQFNGPATGAGASFDPATAVSDAAGLASTTVTAIRAGGGYNVSASVGALTQNFALTNEAGFESTLSIVSNTPNPSNPDQAVTVTIDLPAASNAPAPSGSVAVTANTGEACSIVLPASSCSITFTTLGERVIQAFYPGDASYVSSKAVFVNHTVQPLPTLRIDDVSLNEGNSGSTAFVFTVTLDNASGAAVSVDYATADDSAIAPGDYAATSGTLNFAGSTTTQTITVQVVGDTTTEPDEHFFVNLTSASGATIADAQGRGTILEDDQAPLPSASINDVIVQEPVLRGITQTLARFLVSLDRPAPAPVSLRVRTLSGTAIQNQDFDGNDFIVRFAAGQQFKSVAVFIRDDNLVEPTESFSVELSAPQGLTIADAIGEGSILDDGPDAGLTVNSAADPGDGNCTPADCTLREAIVRANQLQSVRIGFAIPGNGPHTILLGAPLPNPGARIHTIDGYTQPGSRPNSVAIATGSALDADHRVIIDGSAFGGSVLKLRHGGTLRGLKLQQAGIDIINATNGRPTRIVGNDIGGAIFLRPNFRAADGLVDMLVGGDGPDRNRIDSLSYSMDITAPLHLTRLRVEGNIIGSAIQITDTDSRATFVNLVGNTAPGVQLNPGSSAADGVNPGLVLESSRNTWTGDPAIVVGPSNFREFRRLRFVGDHFAPGAQAALIHPHSAPNNSHRVLVVPASMGADPDVIDLGVDGPTANDIGDLDSGPNDLLNYPELLTATLNDRGDRLRIRFRLEPDSAEAGQVAHFYARDGDQLQWLGARAYAGGIHELDLTLPRRLALGTEIHALAENQRLRISSERAATPALLTGNQLLAQARPTRENAGVLRFAIRSERPLVDARTLRFRSIDGSARAGSDYSAVDGSVQAPAGEFEVFVDVPLINDMLIERDESFQLEVWSDQDFGLGSALATATILDDDILRRDQRQFDVLDLDALDGRRGFRIEHKRADEAVLIDLGDFTGGPGNDLALAISEVGSSDSRGGFYSISSVQLLPDLAPPFAPMLQIGRGTLQFPLLLDGASEGAGLLALPMGAVRGAGSRPTLGLRSNSGAYLIHGRSTPLAATNSIQSLASGANGQTLSLPNPAERVVAIGDVNGDGRDDFAIAAPPIAHVLLGRNDGAPLTVSFTISTAGGALGLEILQVAGAGDLNRDGRDDMVVRGRNAAGHQLWLVPGRTSFSSVFVPASDQVQIVDPFGNGATDLSGSMEFAFGSIGPVIDTSTPLDTLVLAAPETDGGLTLLFEAPTLAAAVQPTNRMRILPAFPGDRTGQGLAVLDDFDGDNRPDLAIGIPGAEVQRTGTGRIAILRGFFEPGGSLSLGDTSLPIQWLHGQQEQRAGWRLAALGDVDGDGRGDLGVTAPAVGRSYVVFSSDVLFRTSSEERPPAPATVQVYSSAEGPGEIPIRRSAGVFNEVELLPAGDFDGDGRGDVLIGQPSVVPADKAARRAGRAASVAGEGAIALLLSSGPSVDQEFDLDGLPLGAVRIRRAEDPELPIAAGYAVGGDYNGDGLADVTFLATSLDRFAIVYGRGAGDFMPAFLDPFRDGDVEQVSGTLLKLANLGDVDGDGFDDLGVLVADPQVPELRNLQIHFGSANGPGAVRTLEGVRSIGSSPGIGRVRTDGSGAGSLVIGLGASAATIIFGGAHLRANPIVLSGHTLRITGQHLVDEATLRVAGLGDVDGDGLPDFGIAHSPISRDGSPVGHIEILRGRASFPAIIDLNNPEAGAIQGRVLLRGSGVHAITSLDGLSDRNGDGRRELLITLGEAEGHAASSGKVHIVHGFGFAGGAVEVREVDDVVPIGAGLTIRNAVFGSDALVQARSLGNPNPGLDDILFGAQTDDLRGLGARKGRLLILRSFALPAP